MSAATVFFWGILNAIKPEEKAAVEEFRDYPVRALLTMCIHLPVTPRVVIDILVSMKEPNLLYELKCKRDCITRDAMVLHGMPQSQALRMLRLNQSLYRQYLDKMNRSD